MPDPMLIRAFKDGHIPKCVYCKGTVPWRINKKDYPDYGRGRWGEGRFCSLSCIEQWARRHFTGVGTRRGLSHGKRGGE